MREAKLILRADATLAELQSFYEAHRDRLTAVPSRPDGDHLRSLSRRQFYSLHRGDDSIAAAGAIYDYGNDVPGIVELSDTLIAPDFEGFALQRLLFRIRVAAVILTQGETTTITAAALPSNGRSIHNIDKCGFVPWQSPIEEAFASCGTCECAAKMSPGRRCCSNYFELPRSAAQALVKTILEERAAGTKLKQRGSGAPLTVDLLQPRRFLNHPEYLAVLALFVSTA